VYIIVVGEEKEQLEKCKKLCINKEKYFLIPSRLITDDSCVMIK
jgi:hypothetical protein